MNSLIRGSLAEFVRRHPAELASGPVVPTPAGFFTAGRYVDLRRAHDRMIARPYATDPQRFGRADYWAVDFGGDCEDRALAAHRWLAARGWPRPAMRLVLCQVPRADFWQAHIFLEIRITLDGGEVLAVALDNRLAQPLRSVDLVCRAREIVEPAKAGAR